MPMKKDPQNGGTNADGSKSVMYCSYCYPNGAFTQADFTAQQMKAFCTEKMIEMKIPRLLAKFLAMGIPKLERWRN
jgi:hypothetical protein